jgi:hypothetical protein
MLWRYLRPRICLENSPLTPLQLQAFGMRYAYIALKMAIVKTLTKFKVVKCEKTVDKLVFDVAKNYYNGGVMFKIEKLDQV